MRLRLAAILGVLWLAAACSSPPPTFSLTRASVDPTYWCAAGANNAPYDLHAGIQARNDTAQEVSIGSAGAVMVLTAIRGSWLERVGDRYEAAGLKVSPATIAPRSAATLKLTIPSACTSGRYGPRLTSSGTYDVRLQLVTSAGMFAITATNKHEIVAG